VLTDIHAKSVDHCVVAYHVGVVGRCIEFLGIEFAVKSPELANNIAEWCDD